MFPLSVIKAIEQTVPKFNPIIAKGLAVEHMPYAETYVDKVFKAASINFPQGFVYEGCRRCTPLEEYAIISSKKNGSTTFDVARSDVFLVEYKFSYKGVMLPSKHLFLPFVGQAGEIYLNGSRFVISPVLADKVISISPHSVFVRLLKARLTFSRIPHHFRANNSRESAQVAWSRIYNKKVVSSAPKATVRANCALVHYLLCKYGLSGMFERFCNFSPVIGGEEINSSTYPEQDWVICSSTQIKPKGFGKQIYEKNNVFIAVPRAHYNETTINLLAGFYYVFDHFPGRVQVEYLQPNYAYQIRLWRILLGHVIWSGDLSEGKLVSDVDDHIASLDEYIDPVVTLSLKDIGHDCDDIYRLFFLIIEKFNLWLLDSDDKVSTMYGKELSVLPFVLYDITSAINNLYFKLKAASKKELTDKKIIAIMQLNLKPGLIFSLARQHGEVTTTTASGDNMLTKITCILVPQSGSAKKGKGGKKDRTGLSDPSKRLHASIAEVGNFSGIPKSDPSSRSRINPCLQIDSSGSVVRSTKFIELIDSVQAKISR